jgi:hypothetical protein
MPPSFFARSIATMMNLWRDVLTKPGGKQKKKVLEKLVCDRPE